MQVSPIEVDLSLRGGRGFQNSTSCGEASFYSHTIRNEHEQNTQRNDRLSLISADERIETYEFVHTLNTHCTLKQEFDPRFALLTVTSSEKKCESLSLFRDNPGC